MSNIKNFKDNKYCYVKNAVSKDICEIAKKYTVFEEKNNFSPEFSTTLRPQVESSHSIYADSLMESLLIYCIPIIENNTGLSVSPSYSYYRLYRSGDSLHPHKDRPSCEISASLFLGKNYPEETWKLYIEGTGYEMSVGDMIIYRGSELNHYRYEWESEPNHFHSQVFLHYVDNNGPYSEYKYDKRVGVGGVDERMF